MWERVTFRLALSRLQSVGHRCKSWCTRQGSNLQPSAPEARTSRRKSFTLLRFSGWRTPQAHAADFRPVPTIHCGCSDPDPKVEAKVVAARAAVNPQPGFEGCGRLMNVWASYRCTECNRVMHRACLIRHFADHKSVAA